MKFHYLARAIVMKKGKVLLAHARGAENTFLPGGHIELGEKAESALLREITEELGADASIRHFIGALECAYTENGQANHEIDLLFELDVPGMDPELTPVSREEHIEFLWSTLQELKMNNLLPAPLIECLRALEKGYRAFWGSSFS